jgi:hypothetical protein
VRWHDEWDEAAWYFTYVDEDDKSKPVLQGGLVAIFYVINAAEPERRKALINILREFGDRYSAQLQWGAWGSGSDFTKNIKSYTAERFQASILNAEQEIKDNVVQFIWSSGADMDHADSYQIGTLFAARWYERVHKAVSYLRFHFPVDLLHSPGRQALVDDLLKTVNHLKPLNGYMGLGFQQCYESHRYEDLEYDNAIKFNGLDVGNPIGRDELRYGIKSVNWLTFVDDSLLALIGGRKGLTDQATFINHYLFEQATLKHEPPQQLTLHFYDGGVMVQAGDWPQLGWVEHDPYPVAYVAANLLLRPVRVKELGSLHLGSIVGEVRFNKASSNEWLRRFDAASDAMQREMDEVLNP